MPRVFKCCRNNVGSWMPFARRLLDQRKKNGYVTEIRCGRKCRKAMGTGKVGSGPHLQG